MKNAMRSKALETIDQLKDELNAFRPLAPDVVGRVGQKLRIELNYHSNAIEGNAMTLGETRNLILHGLTARGKPMRDHLDIQGHDDAVKAVEDAVRNDRGMTEVFIRNLHRVLLREPYDAAAITPDGTSTKRHITIGDYKTVPNNVRTSTGETYYFTPPEQVKPAMSDLIDGYRKEEAANEHPVIIAATFHYRFVRIHPFDDGNGRMARLLMNLILIKHGYTVAIIPVSRRKQYIEGLERIDKTEDLAEFIDYVAACSEYALNLHLRAARGESIEDADDIDREIELFKRSLGEDAGLGQPIALRGYVDDVLGPLYDYCRSKVEQLSDVFTMTSSRLSLHLRGMDNVPVDVVFGAHVRSSQVPENALKARADIVLALWWGKDPQIFLSVSNDIDTHETVWRFELRGDSTERLGSYAGRDMNELKLRFNGLLRALMVKAARENDA